MKYQTDILEPFCEIIVKTKWQDMSVIVKDSGPTPDSFVDIFRQVMLFLTFSQERIDEALPKTDTPE